MDFSKGLLFESCLVISVLSVSVVPVRAAPVDQFQAALAARGWYELRFRDAQDLEVGGTKPKAVLEAGAARLIVAKGRLVAYAFDTPGRGCIAIAADDELAPVFYYSLCNRLTVPGALPVRLIMEGFAERIGHLQNEAYRKTGLAHPLWAVLTRWPEPAGAAERLAVPAEFPTGPLLTTIWSQGNPYNEQCPIYQGERLGAGCVPIAMAQVMRYWQHPVTGSGSHCYYWSLGEETLCADFGSATYDWANMPDETTSVSPQVVRDAVSTLCYHCGVSVETQYSPSGSGASFDGRALTEYFGYKYTRLVRRSNYSDKEWFDLMCTQIDRGQPVLYKLTGAEGSHMAVLDGYDGPDLVHLNMGLGGSQDGWYSIDTSPGVSRPENWAVVNIRPHQQPATYHVNGAVGCDTWDGMAPVCSGDTHGPKKTIQAGIYATGPRDTVIVAEGTYTGVGNRDIDFGDRLITVRSVNGATSCIIDCERGGRGFYFDNGATELATVDGFTIQNGSADHGGGIFCWYGSPTIINCVITGNVAGEVGGGLYGCAGTIQNCTITGNSADFGGGLAFCDGAICNSVIAGNTAGQVGGGLCECGGTIQNSVIAGNSAKWGGGLGSCKGTIRSCVITANTAADQVGGGAVSCDGEIQNCTIAWNSAEWGGGLGWCNGAICNSVIWGNTSRHSGQLYDSAEPVSSCVENGTRGGKENIVEDPHFVDPDGADNDITTYWDNDYRLAERSPCVDSGKNEEWMWRAVDIDGNPRIFPGASSLTVDMGAYEYGSFPFRIETILRVAGGKAELTWNSRPGDTYTIWSCLNLVTGEWNEETIASSQGQSTTWTDPDTMSNRKFYKIELR